MTPSSLGNTSQPTAAARPKSGTTAAMADVYIAGVTGRLGSEVARLAAGAGFQVVDVPEQASVWMLALPRTVVEGALSRWTAPRRGVVIDLSGAFKARGVGTYALLADATRVWSGASVGELCLLANPGCIASAVICGLARSGLQPFVAGGLHITAVTAGSAAGTATTGTMRPGHRWWDHPHVAEIERALDLPCASFVPVVDYGLERGIVATICGTARPEALALPADDEHALDVAQVQGTAELRWQRRVREHPALGVTFSLVVALDNLTFPAANAVALATAWLAARGPT